MIAVEPDLRQVGEAVVLGNLPRRQVAVVVDDRQIAGEAVIELDRAVVLQEEVFGDEDVVHVQMSLSGGSAAANSAKHAASAARSTPEGRNQALARREGSRPFPKILSETTAGVNGGSADGPASARQLLAARSAGWTITASDQPRAA